MKVALVAPSPIPFIIGGAEKFFIGMVNYLNKLSIHDVELIKVPCKDWEFWSLMDCYRRFSQLNLDHFDMVITTKYPAWMVKHKNHVVYMQHTCRGVYDLYPLTRKPKEWEGLVDRDIRLKDLKEILKSKPTKEKASELLNLLKEIESFKEELDNEIFDFPGPLTRAIIRFLDSAALSPNGEFGIKSYFAISKNVAMREGYFPTGVKVKVVHHPSNLEEFHTKSYDFIFTASRLESLKRIDLLIEAFKKVKGDIKFLIAGTGGQEERFKELAKEDERIEFLGFVTDEELIDYYSRALFVPFIPYDEDYGLITVEAMKSGKAVLTTYDSGGVTELVKNGYNGLVVEPKVDKLAEAIEEMVRNRDRTIEMGKRARGSVSHISWENVIGALFGEEALKKRVKVKPPEVIITEDKRPLLLVLSTFPIYPPISGGKRRIYNLYKNLLDEFRVTVLSLNHESKEIELGEGFKEVRVKRTEEFNKLAKEISEETGVSSDDIASIEGYSLIPEYLEKLNELNEEASAVILSHPYLFNSVENIDKPILYDAHNVEYYLKRAMFKNRKYLEMVKEVERKACQRAELIYPVSEKDAEGLAELYGVSTSRITIVENGVDAKGIELISLKEKRALKERLGLGDRVVAVFTGNSHKPNYEAAELVKGLAKEFKDAIFIVVGGVGDALGEVPPNLITTGTIPEEEKDIIMKAADIGLNPMISGSGTNLKLLEYLAYGLVTVSTRFGARGISYTNEILTCEVDDLNEAFEEAVKLTKNEKVLEELRLKVRELAEKYDWSVLAKKLKDKILKLLTS